MLAAFYMCLIRLAMCIDMWYVNGPLLHCGHTVCSQHIVLIAVNVINTITLIAGE